MKTVLVTAIGTVTSTAIVKELKRAGGFYIIGADINKKHEIAASLDVDEYCQFPYSTGPEYVSFALQFCREHHVEYYYAVIDKEVVNITGSRDRFQEIGTRLCTVNYEFAQICHFKDAFGNWLAEHMPEIAIREYTDLEKIRDSSFPLFVKPNEGAASAGCRKIDSYEELLADVDVSRIGKTILVQDFITGSNITVDCVRNRKTGQTIQIQRRELLRNANGCGIAVEIIHDRKLEEICSALMEKLDLNGVVNMEFFETETGFRIIEINPRFSAGTMYTCMAGNNTVLNAMQIADEEPCVFGDVAVGSHFAERYEAYRMD